MTATTTRLRRPFRGGRNAEPWPWPERVEPFVPPAQYPPTDDAPEATKHAYVLNTGQQALRVRIAQLEHTLKQAGVPVPAMLPGWPC